MPRFSHSVSPLGVALLATFLGACSVGHAPAAHQPTAGQLITESMIEDSGLSTGWDVLRRYADHLVMQEHGNGPVSISRRGRESIYLSEEPLLLVDGVKQRDFRVLSVMPARDISSMRILSALDGSIRYGTRAASGVIMVVSRQPMDDAVSQ